MKCNTEFNYPLTARVLSLYVWVRIPSSALSIKSSNYAKNAKKPRSCWIFLYIILFVFQLSFLILLYFQIKCNTKCNTNSLFFIFKKIIFSIAITSLAMYYKCMKYIASDVIVMEVQS